MGLVKRNGARWFREELFPDVAMEFKVDRVIANLRTRDAKGKPLQHLQVLGTPRFGRVLGLDGITQTTEGDEAYYHEAVVHCAANSCVRPPETILLIGCDGGTLREALTHNPRRVDVVDIDREVIELVKKRIPSIPEGAWSDTRVRLTIADGAVFVRNARRRKKRYDLIVVDSPDPVGPAVSLFRTTFYLDIACILARGGVLIRQTGSSMLQPDEMPSNYRQMREVFPKGDVQTFMTSLATYIGGYFTFVAASHEPGRFKRALRSLDQRAKKLPLDSFRWYSPAMHRASMVLPAELERTLAMSEYGRSISLDLFGCDHARISSADEIKRFAREICRVIEMKPFGEPLVPDFGHAKSRTAGPSLVQLIETSAITAHFSPHWRTLHLDIFTCSTLEAFKAVEFSARFFGAERADWELRIRGRISRDIPADHSEYRTERVGSEYVTTRYSYGFRKRPKKHHGV
ncbi:MAG: hypothetical protein A2847_01240 [Candidatus Sungbacteria bacterium RIFCSPHIGHO2_01_FULL_50_25]|uniref:Polyamine aminopropyltransferase n=1 Tax=Candidatus Sungbacteria bacterium RIFCSPHIGHO2_01_FULL_50_25 TaxID=1802265 RepID=A0A1G2K9L6_9BACT|nr:MAG: hypothetical protein A2847_01240 [Candidatus Sungbacteria bacterium RIFCSPHIGHO2_01_FULL_50_25]